MNFDQIMKLIDAGFTREEIMGFSAQKPADDPKPVDDQKPADDPKPADDMSAVLAAIKATNENISRLALMQGVKNIPTQETTDDILPQFIRV